MFLKFGKPFRVVLFYGFVAEMLIQLFVLHTSADFLFGHRYGRLLAHDALAGKLRSHFDEELFCGKVHFHLRCSF